MSVKSVTNCGRIEENTSTDIGNRISLILSIANPERKARDLYNTLALSKMCLDKSPFPRKGTKRSRVNVASFMIQFPFSFFVSYAKGMDRRLNHPDIFLLHGKMTFTKTLYALNESSCTSTSKGDYSNNPNLLS